MTGSSAEILLAAQLEQAGIPFEREFRFAPPRRWRADAIVWHPAYSGFRMADRTALLIEIDGGAWTGGHRRGKRADEDCEKGNAAALMSFRVLHFTPAMVEDGRALAVIRAALGIEVAA